MMERGILKLVTFTCKSNPTARVGVMQDTFKRIVDISRISVNRTSHNDTRTVNFAKIGSNMQSTIEGGEPAIVALKDVLQHTSADALPSIPMDEITLKPPLFYPKRNVFCVGKNYKDHVAEVAAVHKSIDISGSNSAAAVSADLPKFPIFFTKAPQSIIAHTEGVENHSTITKVLDYEAELAVVIGKAGKNITPANALSHVFGYTIANDITARDLQKKHVQWFKGKTLDTTCPMGPCIVPRSDLDASDLKIQLWINGQLRQNSRTSNMIFDIPEIIAQLSQGFTLLPGDVILTGTPDGVGFAMKPPQPLKAGDKMRISVEHIGTLDNFILQ